MKINAHNVDEYLEQTDPKWKDVMRKMRAFIKQNIPKAFEETLNHNMVGYVVPLRVYPKGNLGNPNEPLPFINIAAQKDHIALYHMGLNGNEAVRSWFLSEYERTMGKKADLGKSCVRFKQEEDIPYDLIKILLKKINAEEYIIMYERNASQAKEQ
jgi:uncharacterized protein YdhG (YjbR/CyaY superfamily)